MHTLSGVRWIAGEKLLCGTGNPVWSSVMTWRGGKFLMNYSTVCFLTHTYAVFNVQNVCVVAMSERGNGWMASPTEWT